MADPAHPVETARLTDPAMLMPHESLNLNAKRGLLAAEAGNGLSAPAIMSIYDVSQDCRHHDLQWDGLAARFGHESGFSPDGNTFWIGGGEGIAAVDVSNPKAPHTIWEGNVFAHGLNVSDDGDTLYDSNPIDGRLTLLDVSQIQNRVPNPKVNEISSLTWDTVSVPQNTAPMQIGGKPYLLEFDEFAFRFNPVTISDQVGAARIIDIADPLHPQQIGFTTFPYEFVSDVFVHDDHAFVTTDGTFFFLGGVVILFTDGTDISPLPAQFDSLGTGSLLGIPYVVIAGIVVGGVTLLFSLFWMIIAFSS